MLHNSNKRIVGAFIVGFALLAGTYTVTSMQTTRPTGQAATVREAAVRAPVAVLDTNQNGIEDWRDSFVVAEPIVIDTNRVDYVAPVTLTGNLGINFFQNILSARVNAPFGKSEEEVIKETVGELATETTTSLFDTPDVEILRDWSDTDVKNYANAVAGAMVRNNVSGTDQEIEILYDVVRLKNSDRINDLETLVGVYENTLNDTLLIPVPAPFVKQHLDLLNSYKAIHDDILGMTKSVSDPAVALLRLKRYEDDALGLQYSLQNMYAAIEPYSRLFTASDQALLFNNFNPNNQI